MYKIISRNKFLFETLKKLNELFNGTVLYPEEGSIAETSV